MVTVAGAELLVSCDGLQAVCRLTNRMPTMDAPITSADVPPLICP
jgi:hypothetical protein